MPDFDPDAYLAKKTAGAAPGSDFDPDAYLAKRAPREKMGVLDALTVGGKSGYTKNWLDEAAGAIAGLGEGESYRLGPDGKPQRVEPGQLARERSRAEYDQAMEDQPAATIAGNIGGELASDALVALATRNVVNPANPIAGAALGALSGAGAGDENSIGGKWGGAAIGAGSALVGHGVGKYVAGPIIRKGGELLKHVPDVVREFAERRAFKAAGPMLKDFRKARGLEGAEEMGRDLLDQGIVKFGRNSEEIAEAATPKVAEVGKRIGAVRSQLDESLPEDILPTGEALAERIRKEVAAPLLASPANRKFAQAVLAQADEFAAEGANPVNMSKLTGWKKDLADQINFGPDPAFPHQLKNKVRRILQDEEDKLARIGLDEDPSRRQISRFADDMDDIGKAADDPASLAMAQRMRDLASKVGGDTANYRELKRLYGNLAEVADFSGDHALRSQANRIVSPSDHGIGAAMAAGKLAQGGSAAEASLSGMALAFANKVVRERGNSASAVMMDKLSKFPPLRWASRLTGESAEKLGQYAPALLRAGARGPQALAVTLYVLSQKDPEFRKLQGETR
jgi:hypothetical protein